MTLLTREQLLAPREPPHEYVDVPELGGTVRVRGLSASEKDEFEGQWLETKGPSRHQHYRARLLARCLIDDKGARLFTDKDIPALGALPVVVLDKLVLVAQKLSGMAKEDVKERAENFDETQGDSVPSDSASLWEDGPTPTTSSPG